MATETRRALRRFVSLHFRLYCERGEACIMQVQMRRTATALASLLVTLMTATFAATVNVPADQPTIQAGINAAVNGDTVLVAPGTYFENISFNGKAISVKGSGGPKATIIDGGQKGSVVSFTSGETLSAVLSGFTIQ